MVAAAEHRYRSWYPRRHVLLLDYERSEAIAMLARSAGRPLKAAAKQPSFASGAGKNQAPLYREAREKMTNNLIGDQG